MAVYLAIDDGNFIGARFDTAELNYLHRHVLDRHIHPEQRPCRSASGDAAGTHFRSRGAYKTRRHVNQGNPGKLRARRRHNLADAVSAPSLG